jgi:hypothetical protein
MYFVFSDLIKDKNKRAWKGKVKVVSYDLNGLRFTVSLDLSHKHGGMNKTLHNKQQVIAYVIMLFISILWASSHIIKMMQRILLILRW